MVIICTFNDEHTATILLSKPQRHWPYEKMHSNGFYQILTLRPSGPRDPDTEMFSFPKNHYNNGPLAIWL